MIRTALRYHAPATIGEACDVLAGGGEAAAVLGGGTWLVPMLTRGERALTDVVDLRGLGLAGVRESGGDVLIGARTTYTGLLRSALVRERAPLLWTAASGITGGGQVRNVGTVGGSACQATPSSDMPACLVGLGARMLLHGPSGAREVPAADFFVDAFRTALGPAEILTGIAIAIPSHAPRSGYHKLKLCESSWPIATAVAVVGAAGASVTLGGVQATPLRIDLDVDGDGRLALSPAEIDARVAERMTEPWDDVLAPGSYRREIAGPVARRALRKATEAVTG